MVINHPSRIFANGDATTLSVTLPAAVVTDSQFPFDDGRLLVTSPEARSE